MSKWTLFEDKYMHGVAMTDYQFILINEEKSEAVKRFEEYFGFNPLENVCDICESHYSTETEDTIEQVTGYVRNCKFDEESCLYLEEPRDMYVSDDEETLKYQSLKSFLNNDSVLVLK